MSLIGNACLILALLSSVIHNLSLLIYNKFKELDAFDKFIRCLSFSSFAAVLISFLYLSYSYIISDYSIENVYLNSHHDKPLIYKISGIWGSHEGSILLFTLLLSGYNLFYNILGNKNTGTILASIIHSFITSGFLLFIILTSNPFKKILIVPTAGLGLNPILQDIALAIHPPLLYFGYVGFSILFAMAVAALLQEKIDKTWISHARRFALMSFAFLTIGIGLGSWWAYRELGWGGYWFWDPVENSSLMPWLIAAALIHSLFILEKKGHLALWTIFLSILIFCLCLVGLFLVRSGILTSVHSFANSPERGIFILIFLFITITISFVIFAVKAGKISSKGRDFGLLSKEGFIIINNFLMLIACFIVFIGTLYPLFVQAFFKRDISVGHPYFNANFLPVMTIAIICLSFVPTLKFSQSNITKVKSWLLKSLAMLVAISVIIILYSTFINGLEWSINDILPISLLSLLSTVIVNNLIYYWQLSKNNKSRQKPIRTILSISSHLGMIILIIGVVISSFYKREQEVIVGIGDKINISDYRLQLKDITYEKRQNYVAEIAAFEIYQQQKKGYLKQIALIYPERRFYPVENQQTTEAKIIRRYFSDLYVVIGNKVDSKRVVRVYSRPFINLIWCGVIIMFLSFLGITLYCKQIQK